MNPIVAYLQASWPTWIAIAVASLPSLITALTPYPKVDGFLKELLQFLNLFSVLVHRDSPGTLKPPLTFSKPPLGSVVRYGHIGRTVAALLVLCCYPMAACAAFQGLVQKTISCDDPNVVGAIPGILSIVMQIIQGGDNWNSSLTTLGDQQGIDIVGCALQQAIALLGTNSSVSAIPAKVPSSVAIARATAWIATHTK